MDLRNLDTTKAASEGAVMEVTHPATGEVLRTDDGTALSITLLGADSNEMRTKERARLNKRMGKTFKQLARTTLSAEQLEEEALESLISATKAWSGFELDGAPLDCNEANIRMIYTKFIWLKEQVDEFIADRANFLGN